MIYLYLSLAFVVGYLFGNINFARIFSKLFGHKDITTVGSKNPGTMNMLRTRGFGEAMLTLAFEAIKSGVPAICCYYLFENYFSGFGNLAYFLIAFGAIIGHCYPVFYKFKGGKGVACTFGMFVFHPNFWWLSLVVFVICFVLFFFIEYPFIISFLFILTMTVYATCFFAINLSAWFIPLIVILWLNFLLIVFMHRGNLKRFFAGKENKVNFKEKVFKSKKKVAQETTKVDVNGTTEEVTKEENQKEEEKND